MNSLLCKRKATVSYDLEEGELSSAPQKKIKITTTKMSFASDSNESEISLSQEKVKVVYNQESGVVQVRASSALVYKAWNSNQVMKRPKFHSPARVAFGESKKIMRKHSMVSDVYNQLVSLRNEGLTMLDVNNGISLFNVIDSYERNLQMEIEIVECPHRNIHKEIGRCQCIAHNMKPLYQMEKCHVILKLLEISIPNRAVLLGSFISNCLQYIINKKGEREFSLPHSNSIPDFSDLLRIQENLLVEQKECCDNMENPNTTTLSWESQEMKESILNFFRAFYTSKEVSPFDNSSCYQCSCEPIPIEANTERVRVQA